MEHHTHQHHTHQHHTPPETPPDIEASVGASTGLDAGVIGECGDNCGAGTTFAGIDTHSDFHVVAVIDRDAHLLHTLTIPTTGEGLHQALTLLISHHVTRTGIEGTSSYGQAMTRLLQDTGLDVVEVTGPDRSGRRRRGKSDTLDAEQAANAARTNTRIRPAKRSHHLAELRSHYDLHESAVRARTQVGNQILALYPGCHHGTSLGKLTITRLRELANTPGDPQAHAAARWLALNDEATHYEHAMTQWLQHRHQALLGLPQCGPISASALVLAAGDNPDRLTSEAQFANLCGVAPLPASSGKHQHHRLNRGGDRQANRALHTIITGRRRTDSRTQTYAERRTTHDRMTSRAINRCLTRYLVREIFPILQRATLDIP